MANQGIYHPTYNPNGSKKLSDGNFWYNTSVPINSTMDCFDSSKMLVASGSIGTTSGRIDGTFYDQIVENSILDLRNSSKKVEDYSRLREREFNKLVAGTTRGKEAETQIIAIRTFTKSSTFGININRFYFGITGTSYPEIALAPEYNLEFTLVGSNGSVYNTRQVLNIPNVGTMFIPLAGNTQVYIPIDGKNTAGTMNTLFPDGTTITVIVAKRTTRTKSNTLLHCDIIGNPSNYPTYWKESGVFGTPLVATEEGASLLPDGAKDTFKLSRDANATPLLCLRSTDSGATWTSFTPTFNTTTNAITLTDEPAGNLVLVYYQTHTSMAVPVANSEVLEIGKVWAGNNGYVSYQGCLLMSSLIGKIPTSDVLDSTYGWWTECDFIRLPSIDRSNIKFSTAIRESYIGLHNPLLLSGQVNVPACKIFPYLTRLNGKAYLNLVFKEMKYGSYLVPTTVTAASATYTQNLTYKISIAGCALDGKVIKWIGTTTTSAIDWSLYDVSPTGVIYLLSTGAVYTNAKLYDGDSWGDDSKFNIVDYVSTTTDDNGQTVLIGQKTVELPYFIDAGE